MSGGAYGMTFEELAIFCRDRLSATRAASLDGGGSSCMWVKGKGIVNNPSDGGERAVCNGLMMVALQPKETSIAFITGETVKTNSSVSVRLGPGTNFGILATVASDERGDIVSHTLNGVLAKGSNWWKCRFGSVEGWCEVSKLEYTTSAKVWNIYQ